MVFRGAPTAGDPTGNNAEVDMNMIKEDRRGYNSLLIRVGLNVSSGMDGTMVTLSSLFF